MPTCLNRQQLSQLLSGTAEPEELGRWEDHVSSCEACQKQLDLLAVNAEYWAPYSALLEQVLDEDDKQPAVTTEFPAAKTEEPQHTVNIRTGTAVPEQEGDPPTIPDFQILSVLGHGGMGVVYKARQLSLNRLVALKMLSFIGQSSQEYRKRFYNEADAIARLNHVGIVQIYQVGEFRNQPYLVLEYLNGGDLACFLKRAPLSPGLSAKLLLELARTIHVAHLAGVVHRDLKPANILLVNQSLLEETTEDHSKPSSSNTPTAQLKITDFGLAKRLEGNDSLTRTGMVAGTPRYMAPEQASGDHTIGPGADIHALGVILYEMLTGQMPFQGESIQAVLEQVRLVDAIPPSRLVSGIPRDLETICLKCLEKVPRQRYGTAAALADDLQRYLENRPITSRRISALGRFVRFTHREPVLSGLLFLCLCFLLLLVGGSVLYAWQTGAQNTLLQTQKHDLKFERDNAKKGWDQAIENERKERRQKERYLQQKNLAEGLLQVSRTNAYGLRLVLAHTQMTQKQYTSAFHNLKGCPQDLRGWEYHWLQHRCRQNLVQVLDIPQVDVEFAVLKLKFHPKQPWIIGIYGYSHLLVWNCETGILLNHYSLDKQSAMFDCAFTNTGNPVTVGGNLKNKSGEVFLWDLETGKPTPILHDGPPPQQIRFSPDGQQMFASGIKQSVIYRWDTRTWRSLPDIRLDQPQEMFCIHPEQPWIITYGSLKRTKADISIRNWQTGNLVRKFPVHPSTVSAPLDLNAIALTKDQLILRKTDELDLYALESGKILRKVDLLDSTDNSLSYPMAINERETNISLINNRSLVTIDWETGKKQQITPFAHTSSSTTGRMQLAVHPSKRLMAVGPSSSKVYVWQSPEPNVATLDSKNRSSLRLAFRWVGDQLIGSESSTTLTTIDPDTGESSVYWNAPEAIRPLIAVHPTQALIAAISRTGTLHIFDRKTNRSLISVSAPPMKNYADPNHHHLEFSNDGTRLYLVTKKGRVNIVDVRKRAKQKVFSLPEQHCTALDSKNEQIYSYDSLTQSVYIWDLPTGKQIASLPTTLRCMRIIASRHGSYLACIGMKRTDEDNPVAPNQVGVEVWDWRQKKRILTITDPLAIGSGVCFGPDGKRLLTTTSMGRVQVWDLATQQHLFEWTAHDNKITFLTFHKGGKYLYTLDHGYQGKCWRIE